MFRIGWIEVGELALDLARRAEELITQAGIDSEARADSDVVLHESSSIGVALVFAEQPGGAGAGENIADSGAVLRTACAQQKIGEAQEKEETVLYKRLIDEQLMTNGLCSGAEGMTAANERNGILGAEGVGVLKGVGAASRADRERSEH